MYFQILKFHPYLMTTFQMKTKVRKLMESKVFPKLLSHCFHYNFIISNHKNAFKIG